MGKSAFWICIALLGLLQVELVLSALYSSSCDTVSLIENKKEIGIRGGKIPDGHLSASSYSDDNHSPARGRLDQVASGNKASSWCSKDKDKKQWIAVSLVDTMELTAIATQGQFDPLIQKPNVTYAQSWVTEYQVEYSYDNKTYYPIQYKTENPLVFKGNSDGNSTVCNNFPYSVKAKYIRVRPIEWHERICLRIGLFKNPKANFTSFEFGFITPKDKPEVHLLWWWIFFWVILAVLLLILLTVLLFYCCYIRHRMAPHEKVLKEKPPKPTIQRRTDSSFINEAYDMTVMTNKTSVPGTPSSLEDTGDEIQEVTAEFTADEQENQKGIVGFSVADDTKDGSDEEFANGDVNWEKYKKKAMQRPKHTYENVNEIKTPPRD